MPDTSGVPEDAAALRVTVAGLRAENESLRALLEDKNAKITELEAQNAELAQRLARVERLISRNSGNSSMPPSGDDQPGKTPPPPRKRGGSGRKPGKQRGAPGAYLAWNDHPDRTVDLFPEGNCQCGADLDQAADRGTVLSHQVNDLPEEVRAQTVQYDRHEVECACGRVRIADAPPEAGGAAPGTVTYGVNFQAWCVFLMVMHHVPVERCADIIESMAGTRPSDGWVHALLARAARAVAAANTTIRALILLARVICGDETPLRAGPGPKANKKYLQVACTNLLTYYFLGERTLPSFRGFVYSDLHGTVVVHDRYQNYRLLRRHQPPAVLPAVCGTGDYAERRCPGGRAAWRGGARADAGRGKFCIITGFRGRRGAGRAGGTVLAWCAAGWSARVPVL